MNVPGPKEGLTDILDEAIRKHLKERKSLSFPLRPSAAGHCSRKLAYDLSEYKGQKVYDTKPIEPSVYRLLNLGNSVEYSAFRNFSLVENMQVKYKQQVVTLFSLGEDIIEGSVDGVVYSPDWRGVIDIKSAGDKYSAYFKSRWDEHLDKYSHMQSLTKLSPTAFYADDLEAFLNESKDVFLNDNFHQLNAYCCSSFFRERGIDFGSIYKYCKNDSRHYEIRFKPNMKLFEQLKRKFENVYNAVMVDKNPELVDRDYSLGSMRCAFCPYSRQCWGDQDSLKAWFKTFPSKRWPKDIGYLRNSEKLSSLFASFQEAETSEKEKKPLEERIITELLAQKVDKIKLDNGRIYMIKQLKNGLVLRRTKL